MSSGIPETVTIETNKLIVSEWEGQLLKLSMRKRLIHKHSSNKITAIRTKYAPQKEEIRNQIDSLDDSASIDEYRKLAAELQDLENLEDQEIKAVEEEVSEQEGDIDFEMDHIEARKKAAQEDTESLKEMRKQNLQSSFGYFQT